jgi:spore coat protein CotF
MTSDPQLKQIFLNNARIEQEHLNTINMLLSGQVPAMNQQSGMQQQQQSVSQPQMQMQQPQVQRQQTSVPNVSNVSNVMQPQNNGVKWQNSSDKDCCTDMLMTEKYVSNAYDTAIFEFVDPRIRDLLNHIQKEEQKHGESIFVYMQNKGMYQPS